MLNKQEKAFYELALLYASDIGAEVDFPLLEYSVIITCIRHALMGVSMNFLSESVSELELAENITFNLEVDEKN